MVKDGPNTTSRPPVTARWPLDVVEGCAVKVALFVKNCVLKFYINGITVVRAGEPI